jgi:hypothetical protein
LQRRSPSTVAWECGSWRHLTTAHLRTSHTVSPITHPCSRAARLWSTPCGQDFRAPETDSRRQLMSAGSGAAFGSARSSGDLSARAALHFGTPCRKIRRHPLHMVARTVPASSNMLRKELRWFGGGLYSLGRLGIGNPVCGQHLFCET